MTPPTPPSPASSASLGFHGASPRSPTPARTVPTTTKTPRPLTHQQATLKLALSLHLGAAVVSGKSTTELLALIQAKTQGSPANAAVQARQPDPPRDRRRIAAASTPRQQQPDEHDQQKRGARDARREEARVWRRERRWCGRWVPRVEERGGFVGRVGYRRVYSAAAVRGAWERVRAAGRW